MNVPNLSGGFLKRKGIDSALAGIRGSCQFKWFSDQFIKRKPFKGFVIIQDVRLRKH